MSHTGVIATACLDPAALPRRPACIEDLEGMTLDPEASVVACSRNGWINLRVEKIVAALGGACLPTAGRDTVVLGGEALAAGAAELRRILTSLAAGTVTLPGRAVDGCGEDEVRNILAVVSLSLAAALADYRAADARHPDGEHLEPLVRLLWCQVHLAEHAAARGLWLVSARWPHAGSA